MDPRGAGYVCLLWFIQLQMYCMLYKQQDRKVPISHHYVSMIGLPRLLSLHGSTLRTDVASSGGSTQHVLGHVNEPLCIVQHEASLRPYSPQQEGPVCGGGHWQQLVSDSALLRWSFPTSFQ